MLTKKQNDLWMFLAILFEDNYNLQYVAIKFLLIK